MLFVMKKFESDSKIYFWSKVAKAFQLQTQRPKYR